MRSTKFMGLAVCAATIAACSQTTDSNAPSSALAVSMASAYSTAPAGFSDLSSSFDPSVPSDGPFMIGLEPRGNDDGQGHDTLDDRDGDHGNRGPGGPNDHGGFDDHRGPGGFGPPGRGPGFGLGFMGGGLFGAFHGDGIGGFFHDDSCAFSSTTGDITCGPATGRNGLTVTRVTKYTTTDGTAQSRRDSTTNTASTTTTVSGTVTRRDSSMSVVDESSSLTITGMAKGNTQRTVNAKSSASESTTGKTREGDSFTAQRAVGDTVTGVVLPVPSSGSGPAYPTAGTVIRAMSATVAVDGQASTTTTRREVVTYDGSAAATVVITVDGTTQNCTLPLPHGRLTCQ